MESVGLNVDGTVDLDDPPPNQSPAPDERDTVLTNALRRVVEATRRSRQDTIAAFTNYI